MAISDPTVLEILAREESPESHECDTQGDKSSSVSWKLSDNKQWPLVHGAVVKHEGKWLHVGIKNEGFHCPAPECPHCHEKLP